MDYDYLAFLATLPAVEAHALDALHDLDAGRVRGRAILVP